MRVFCLAADKAFALIFNDSIGLHWVTTMYSLAKRVSGVYAQHHLVSTQPRIMRNVAPDWRVLYTYA